jgi:hypothetical protein
MKHILSILILLGFISTTEASLEASCVEKGFYYSDNGVCDPFRNIDGTSKSDSEVEAITNWLEEGMAKSIQEKKRNKTYVIIFSIMGGLIIAIFIISKLIEQSQIIYNSSSIPLKNKVKRKELETKLSELEDVKPAEQTYVKTSYEDETEEINEVKKLERQIKIKKLKKELKELEEGE